MGNTLSSPPPSEWSTSCSPPDTPLTATERQIKFLGEKLSAAQSKQHNGALIADAEAQRKIGREALLLGTPEQLMKTFFNPLLTGDFDDAWAARLGIDMQVIKAEQRSYKALIERSPPLVHLPVKLLLVRTPPSFFKPLARGWAALQGAHYGAIHLALQLGPYIIDFHSDGIMKVRALTSSQAWLAVPWLCDGSSHLFGITAQHLERLARVIANVNMTKTYASHVFFDPDGTKTGVNCHCVLYTIARDVFERDLHELPFAGDVKTFVAHVERNPDDATMWYLDPATLEKVVITSRLALNNKAKALQASNAFVANPTLKELLHGFDRALALRGEFLDDKESVFGDPKALAGTFVVTTDIN